ncbi:ash family protein [Pseudomonas reactans]|nr:ash family protein [Pseudomonas reactans]
MIFIRQPLHTYCLLLVHVINNASMVAQAGQPSGWPVIRCGR